MDLYDVCIIGAGAAGMTAGIAASGHGSNVIIIDKNKKAGMKLYATGNPIRIWLLVVIMIINLHLKYSVKNHI